MDVLRLHSTSFQAPVPTGFSLSASTPCLIVHAFGTSGSRPRASQSVGAGSLVCTRTVESSTFSQRLTYGRVLSNCVPAATSLIPCLSRLRRNMRSRLKSTVSALNASPSWNFTPRRRLNSHAVSPTGFQARASPGTGLPCGSTSTRLSKTWRM